ncbi:hypothetical protein JCM10908_004667 [Rhodotorula pacifica]|uniref:uncharacterized protein n=1 Tax=Rhodotorula pacifica TaxID=1495444 RepID=UPI00317D1C48
MGDPHAVPLPASRGSLDSVRGSDSLHGRVASTSRSAAGPLDSVDEDQTAGDEAWFADGDEHEQPLAPPDEQDDSAQQPEAEEEPPVGDAVSVAVDASGDQPADPPQTPPPDEPVAYADEGTEDDERTRALEDELERTRADRDAWEEQYQGLLAKLTTMRSTVGDKLRQDADELDRREQEIADLRAANDDLSQTVETLKAELIQSHGDADALHTELEKLRARAFDSERANTDEAQQREIALRESQEDLERVRIERDEWEGEAMRERVRREELAARQGQIEMELAQAKADRETLREERDREAESAANLSAVLEEFQATKDRELQGMLGDLQDRLYETERALTTFRKRAEEAESRLHGAHNDSQKVLDLAKEVKEKNLLIGKLRHEAVILNEHLIEAMRRLKRDSGENSVDRRLVSNVLITFITTPRGDSKRFEMLQLIASILSWTDDQREKVGLQRASGALSSSSIISSGRAGARGHSRSGKGKAVEDDGVENESFSNLWIEFLLKEAGQGATAGGPGAVGSPSSSSGPTSPPLSPNGSRLDLPPLGSPPVATPPTTRRPGLSSFFSSNGGGTASSPSTSSATPSIKEEGAS